MIVIVNFDEKEFSCQYLYQKGFPRASCQSRPLTLGVNASEVRSVSVYCNFDALCFMSLELHSYWAKGDLRNLFVLTLIIASAYMHQ